MNLMKPEASPFNLGDLVRLITNEYESGLTELKITKNNITSIFKSGQTQMIPPVMVVLEVVCERERNTQLYDEKTGAPIRDKIKVLCQWFSQKKCCFEERWFYAGILVKEEMTNLNFDTKDFKINQIVTLKTAISTNQSIETKIKNTLESTTEKVDYQVIKTFENLNYLPPKMVITGIEKLKDIPNLFDKNTGNWIRLIPQNKINCMWFDSLTGKFSEHKFMDCTLMPASELKDLDFEKYINLLK